MATVIAYVDGFNLYHGLRQGYGRRYLWLDLQHLVQRVRPHDQILAIRYFTAEVKDDPDGLARQRAYLAALNAHSTKVEIVLGRYQTKKMTCRQCGRALDQLRGEGNRCQHRGRPCC
jgi:RNase P subunit RPR2